jgi:PadR family transcriptional regulator
MADQNQEILKGTLEMLILQALEREPMHGWGIADRIEQSSREVFRLQTGTLYPTLHRLLLKGWISAGWRTTENNRRARYYKLTASGRKRLDDARVAWQRTSGAINRIIETLS